MDKTIINLETGEITYEVYTDEEIAERTQSASQLAKEDEAFLKVQREVNAKRQALLNKLGITEEEAKLLLS